MSFDVSRNDDEDETEEREDLDSVGFEEADVAYNSDEEPEERREDGGGQ